MIVKPLLAGEKITAKLRNSKKLGQWLDRSLGAVFIALGIRLAFEKQ